MILLTAGGWGKCLTAQCQVQWGLVSCWMTFSGHLRHFCDGEQIKALLKAANAWQMSKAINYGTQKSIFPLLVNAKSIIVLLFSLLTSSFCLNHNSLDNRLLMTVSLQVAAHLFQAGANIVKLGIQKTRGPEDDNTEELFLGSYWSSFRKLHQHRRWLCQIELSWQRRRCYPRTQ